MTSKAFMNLVKARRSYYNISAKSLVDRSAIKEIVDQAVLHTPTSYNVQGGRVVLFYDEAHSQLWDVVREHTLAWLPKDNEEMIKMQSGKLDGYSAGYGTVVFLEDEDTIAASRKRAPQFGDLFETWTEASSAMLQYVVWTALEAEGFGASLQHHTAMMKELSPALHKAFDIPTQWKFMALMPFGVPLGPPGQNGMPEKTFKSIEERVKVLVKAPNLEKLSSNGSSIDTAAFEETVQVS